MLITAYDTDVLRRFAYYAAKNPPAMAEPDETILKAWEGSGGIWIDTKEQFEDRVERKVYYCAVCGKYEVDAHAGYDTCARCAKTI